MEIKKRSTDLYEIIVDWRTITWHINHKPCRVGAPAVVTKDGYQYWFKDGALEKWREVPNRERWL